jgi:hypothetical protein
VKRADGPWHSRVIKIVCENLSHPAIRIGQLTSVTKSAWLEVRDEDYAEWWEPSGTHVSRDNNIPPELRDGPWATMAEGAGRYRFACPRCGLDILAGDRLGDMNASVGYGAILAAAGSSGFTHENHPIHRATAKGFQTAELLGQWADAGESRISLTTLGRIFQM